VFVRTNYKIPRHYSESERGALVIKTHFEREKKKEEKVQK